MGLCAEDEMLHGSSVCLGSKNETNSIQKIIGAQKDSEEPNYCCISLEVHQSVEAAR